MVARFSPVPGTMRRLILTVLPAMLLRTLAGVSTVVPRIFSPARMWGRLILAAAPIWQMRTLGILCTTTVWILAAVSTKAR
jgi:hypothetical protein